MGEPTGKVKRLPRDVYARELARLQAEQERRFRARLDDPIRRWKPSLMDLGR
ncbi:hypothetical protein [Actinomadura sediminis]|uniref:Polyphosphate kinase-2-related domain-containing protein n=1 Tax=Actinomadura sediminis TaxID=1038904 RepID=A0ABW3EIN9_9ACTN